MSDDLAIQVEDLWVRYRTPLDRKQTLRGLIAKLGKDSPEQGYRIVEAVKGVSFEVPRGSVLGVIGPNGAGKSTMLRAIAGILPPYKGRIVVRGQVSTLLALGVGFNQALSGRENIYIGGLAAGLDREAIAERERDIIEFSGIGDDFIDMPMKTYSSGMKGRLAFAVSTTMDPDILLIDEALSAGDAAFRRKAADRMRQLCSEDRTILLVSHGMGSVRDLADQALWLQKGEVIEIGEPDKVIEAYTDAAEAGDDPTATDDM